jgi:hypothetical protein
MDCWYCDDDNVSLHSFTRTIHVDGAYSGRETGEPHLPFNTFAEGYALAWDGARLLLRPGDYAEAYGFSKRIEVVVPAGTVRLGDPPTLALSGGATVRLHAGGAIAAP